MSSASAGGHVRRPPAGRQPASEKMTAEDVSAAAGIEALSSPTPWCASQIADELRKPYSHFRVARAAGHVVAFGGIWIVAGEAQVAEIAVDPARRRRGFGRRLLRALARDASALGARVMTLEVREGNAGARALYESEGFRETFRRPRCYDGNETAILMEKKL